MRYFLSKTIVSAVMALLAVACSEKDSFRVRGSIEGNPTMNLRVGFYAHDAWQTMITASKDGVFEFEVKTESPTVVEIFDNDFRLLGRVYGAGGDDIECQLSRNNPYKLAVKGNDVAAEWARVLSENAGEFADGGQVANDIIARYVGDNPSNIVSTLLLTTSFDASANPLQADSLLSLISADARPSRLVDSFSYVLARLSSRGAVGLIESFIYMNDRDSMETFNPSRASYSLLVISDRDCMRSDSIVPALHRMAEYGAGGRRRFALLDFSLDDDTLVWKRSIRDDSATWKRGWAAGYVAAPGIDVLGVPSLPFYIVSDSAGHQLYRGSSIYTAERLVDSLMKI